VNNFLKKTPKRVNHLLTSFGYTMWLSKDSLTWNGLMPPFSDPLLVIWEAMNLLAQVDTSPDAPQLKLLLADAEGALCRLTIELAHRAKHQGQSEPQHSKITLH
jgi:hypothetical protein